MTRRGAGIECMDKHGVDQSLCAKVAVKSRTHASNNLFAVFRTPITEQEVLNSLHLSVPSLT